MTLTLIQWAFSSSMLLIIVLLLRALLRGRVSPRLIYGLWLVAALRLMLSITIPAWDMPWAAAELAPHLAQPIEERLLSEAERNGLAYQALIPSELVTWEDMPRGEDVYLCVPLPYDHAPLPPDMTVDEQDVIYRTVGVGVTTLDDKLLPLWKAGAAVTGGVMLLSNLLFYCRLRRRRKPLEGTGSPVPVYIAEGLSSPCLFGGSIYLTSEAAGDGRLREYALAHELTHWQHRDWYWSLVRCGCLVLHWYNPLVWLAAALSKADGELACDADTVRQLGEDRRLDYGRALVDLAARRGIRPADLLSLSTAMTGGARTIRQRVLALVKNRRTARAVLALTVGILCVSAAFAFGAGPAKSPPANFQRFQIEMEDAQAIRYGPELISSQAYPAPITDPDLLADAKRLLSDVAPLEKGEDTPDISHVPVSPRVSFSRQRETDEDTAWSTYYLLREGDWTYVLVQRGGGEYLTYDTVGKTVHSPSALEGVARQQNRRNQPVGLGFVDDVLPDIPAGRYDIFVRNSGDYSQLPAYQDGSISYAATGAVNIWIGRYSSALSGESGNAATDDFQGTLTPEQVDQVNEAFRSDAELPDGSYGPSEISCFFTSSYSDPTGIDLEEFLRYCPIGVGSSLGDDDAEEFLAVMEQDNSWFSPDRALSSPRDLPVPVHRYPRAEVSALLQKYAGVTVEELNWDGCLYVEEYDAFYNFTSDAGPGFFVCAGGQVDGDTVLLWSDPTENGDRCELTLRRSGDRYLIQSHHTAYAGYRQRS